jgi:hypothetical protein
MSNVAELTKINSIFKYTSGGNSQAIWRKYGWVPPSEYRDDYLFKQNREATQGDAHGSLT